jgi:hypothetical protein
VDQVEQLQRAATSLLEKAQQSATVSDLAVAVDKATGVLRLCSELEASRAQARKVALEERKLQHENDTASTRGRFERIKEYVSLSTPIVAIVTLTATLSFQSWQFLQSEKDKAAEAEEAQWRDAYRSVSQSAGINPAIVPLKRFLKSPKYGNLAKETAVQLLAYTTDITFFREVFGMAFVPLGWQDLDYIVRMDRAVAERERPLVEKAWDGKNADERRLEPTKERPVYDYVQNVMPQFCEHVGYLLKESRKDHERLDLSATAFQLCDWRGADLSNSNIKNIWLSHVDLKGANLDGISQFDGAIFWRVAWWEASRMSPALRKYLEMNYEARYDPANRDAQYGPKNETFSPKQYADALRRLEQETP